jgi:hypothetical protein
MTSQVLTYAPVELFGTRAVVYIGITRHKRPISQVVEVRERYFTSNTFFIPNISFNYWDDSCRDLSLLGRLRVFSLKLAEVILRESRWR